MNTAPQTPSGGSKTTPKDFFLWVGAMVALYLSIVSFIALLFSYINYAFPDANAYYGDPYSSTMRFSMASLIVLVPTTLILLRLIRGTIIAEAGKAAIWVRRWVLVLTIFVMTVTILVDLITLVNYFLNGEVTTRFILKIAVVLLVAGFVFMHFLADLKGRWIAQPRQADMVGIAAGVVALAAIVAGFFIVGSPADARMIRFDQQKASDLQNIQYQVINYYQQKETLPESLAQAADPLSGYVLPKDPQTKQEYRYERTGALSFKLCATFNKESRDLAGRGEFPGRDIATPYGGPVEETWKHGVGETCFDRTIDPERYPAFPKPMR